MVSLKLSQIQYGGVLSATLLKDQALVIPVQETGTLHMIHWIIIILSEHSTVHSCMSPQNRSIIKYRQVTFYAISFCMILL